MFRRSLRSCCAVIGFDIGQSNAAIDIDGIPEALGPACGLLFDPKHPTALAPAAPTSDRFDGLLRVDSWFRTNTGSLVPGYSCGFAVGPEHICFARHAVRPCVSRRGHLCPREKESVTVAGVENKLSWASDICLNSPVNSAGDNPTTDFIFARVSETIFSDYLLPAPPAPAGSQISIPIFTEQPSPEAIDKIHNLLHDQGALVSTESIKQFFHDLRRKQPGALTGTVYSHVRPTKHDPVSLLGIRVPIWNGISGSPVLSSLNDNTFMGIASRGGSKCLDAQRAPFNIAVATPAMREAYEREVLPTLNLEAKARYQDLWEGYP